MLDEYLSCKLSALHFADAGEWVIPVLKGVTLNKVVASFNKIGGNVWTYRKDLDQVITVNDRDPAGGNYFVWVRKSIQADSGDVGQSADMRKKSGCSDTTLLERLLLGYGYYLTTGQHLDTESSTLCSGSRHLSTPDDAGYNNCTPYVLFDGNQQGVTVSLCDSDQESGNGRARSVRVT